MNDWTYKNIKRKYTVINETVTYCNVVTDNPLEAVWYANKAPGSTIINNCGEANFEQVGDKWKILK